MNTGKYSVIQKFRTLIYLYIVLFVFSTSVFSAAQIQNLAVSPGTVAPGGQITISFEMRTGGGTGYFAIAYSEDGALTRCENDWLAGSMATGGIYNRVGGTATYYNNGVGVNVTGLTYAGSGPKSGGLVGPSTSTYQTVTVITNVPPEKSGSFSIIVIAREGSTMNHHCGDVQPYDNSATVGITVSGTTTAYKLDLQSYGSHAGDRIKLRYRIYNWSESAVRGNRVVVRYYMNQATQAANYSQNAGNWQYYESDGASNGINYSHSIQFTNTSSSDCDDTGSYTRQTNFWGRIYNPSASNIVIYANGGYLSMNQEVDMVNTTNNPDPTDDYSRGMDNGSYAQNKYLTAYYNQSAPSSSASDVLLCEYTSPSTADSLTGEEPCVLSACAGITAAKSADVTYAYLGDTITFCITVTNTATSDIDTYVWDTVPTSTLYLGCDNSCSVSGGVVSWFVTMGAGQSRMFCFWVKVNAYPFIIRQGEFFAGFTGSERMAAAGRRSVFAIDNWKFWMAFSGNCAVKN